MRLTRKKREQRKKGREGGSKKERGKGGREERNGTRWNNQLLVSKKETRGKVNIKSYCQMLMRKNIEPFPTLPYSKQCLEAGRGMRLVKVFDYMYKSLSTVVYL